MKLSSKELLAVPHLAVRSEEKLKGVTFTGVSTDSRTIAAGNLFVALRGEKFDGHNFLDQAFARGATAAVVDTGYDGQSKSKAPLLVVENTLTTLGALAANYRRKFDIPVIAIAGSNGKTTTKEMIAAVLRTKYEVLSTPANLNNQIGVPQTLFGLEKKHEVAVIEMGTNHPGELAYLSSIVGATHGLITTIGREHLEFFKDLDGVASEEGTLFEDLTCRKGTVAIVNMDDPLVRAKAKGVRTKLTYGFSVRTASVRGKMLDVDHAGRQAFRFSGGRMTKPLEVRLALPGAHNALNGLAAAAVGLAFRVKAADIKAALEAYHPLNKRMELRELNGVVVYNDTYNANPDSMIAALRTLGAAAVIGKKIAVLGDMRELGAAAEEEHRRVGREAAAVGIDYLLTYGPMARLIHDAASSVPFTAHYDQKSMLAEYLAELVTPGDAVLVKASRSLQLEDIVTFLDERLRGMAAIEKRVTAG